VEDLKKVKINRKETAKDRRTWRDPQRVVVPNDDDDDDNMLYRLVA